MKRFLLNILLLSGVSFIILIAGLYLVPDKMVKYTILGALPEKHKHLESVQGKKIILLGGSNVSFGIDSKTIQDSFKIPVINMGVHAGLGLEFILNDIKNYIKKGDIIILMPEYEHFYTDNYYGEMELVSYIFDVDPSSQKTIETRQWPHLIKYLPTYSAKKIKNYIPSLLSKSLPAIDIYHKESFNEYGDAYLHWTLPNQPFIEAKQNTGKEKIYNEVIEQIKLFKSQAEKNNIHFYIFPPVIDEISYDHQAAMINEIVKELKNNNLAFEVNPINYKYQKDLFFNSYYHLNKKGVDIRTKQFIHDLKMKHIE